MFWSGERTEGEPHLVALCVGVGVVVVYPLRGAVLRSCGRRTKQRGDQSGEARGYILRAGTNQ
eukprot:552457-Pyramimonas_sp.AAC.1